MPKETTTQSAIKSIQDELQYCLNNISHATPACQTTLRVACQMMNLSLKFRVNKEDILTIGEMVARITRFIALKSIPDDQVVYLDGLAASLEKVHTYLEEMVEKTQGWNVIMNETQRVTIAAEIATKMAHFQRDIKRLAAFMWIDLDLQIVGGVDDLMQDMHAMMDKLRRVEFYIGAAREGGGTLIRQVDYLVEMAIQLQRGLDFYHQNVSLRNVHVNATFEDSIRTSISRVVDAAKESWRAQKSLREMPLEDMIEDWMLASEDIEYDPTKQSTFLGRGASATVYLGKYKDRQVAVKHFHSVQIANSIELERMIRKEIKAWRDVANERYILTLIGVCTKIATPILVCEYCPYTITRYIYMHPDKLIEMVYQFARGVKSMHDLGIIHRDLKGANVMVTDQGTVAIADFGLSRSTASVLTQYSAASKFVGTLNWMSPEQRFSPRKMTVQSDVWSFGMTVWELLCDEVPFRQWSQEEIECAIRSDDERPDRPEDLPRELERLWELITWCWKVDPLARPKAHEIVSFLEMHYHNEVKAHAQDSLAMETKTDNVLTAQGEITTSPMTEAIITPGQPPMMQSPDKFQGMTFARERSNIYPLSNHIPIHLVGKSDPENNNRRPERILNDPDLLALRIKDADVQCIRQISQSANEEMWIGHHHGSSVIIKRLLPHKSTLSNAISFAREIKVSSKLHHPKIVKLIGISFTTLTNIQAIFEPMNRGDLKTLLELKMKSGGSNPWRDIKIQWAIDIAEALDYLHGITPKHIHGGVNTRNILIDDSGKVSSLQGLTNGAKLFCLCMPRNYQQDEAESECRWLAPEVLRGEIYDEASDVWSFGCFLAELDTGFEPYNDVKDEGDIPLPDFAIALRVSQGLLKPKFSKNIPRGILDLAIGCLEFHPSRRWRMHQVLHALQELCWKPERNMSHRKTMKDSSSAQQEVICMYCSESVEDGNFLEAHVEDCLFGPSEAPADVVQRLLKAASTSVPWRARFLRTPLRPQAHTIQCHIRGHENNLYELFTQNAETPLCSAVRRSRLGLNAIFSIFPANLNDQVIARLERNFVGSKYTVIDTKNEPSEIGAIQYAATFGKTPRQMKVVIPTVSRTSDDSNNMFGTWRTDCYVSSSQNGSILSQIDIPDAFRVIGLVNKPPVWVDSMQAYCLDFGGRIDVASVKNFVLCPSGDLEKSLMVFGRTSDRQVFVMDFQHPLSPVQAFAIALSSLDRHLVTFD